LGFTIYYSKFNNNQSQATAQENQGKKIFMSNSHGAAHESSPRRQPWVLCPLAQAPDGTEEMFRAV
jgi:hypothetical protein